MPRKRRGETILDHMVMSSQKEVRKYDIVLPILCKKVISPAFTYNILYQRMNSHNVKCQHQTDLLIRIIT